MAAKHKSKAERLRDQAHDALSLGYRLASRAITEALYADIGKRKAKRARRRR